MPENNNEEGVKSPFMDQPKIPFDYESLQDNTAVKAMRESWAVFGQNVEKMAPVHTVSKEEWQENLDFMAQKVMNILIECNVAHTDMQKMLDNFYSMLQFIFTTVSRQYNEYEKELLARTIGTRNPGTNKYSREYATVGDLYKALEAIREKHGDQGADYFFIDKK